MQYLDYGSAVVEHLQVDLVVRVVKGEQRLQVHQERLPHALRCLVPDVPVQEKVFQDLGLFDFQSAIATTPI